jgi:uncharacterized protein
VARIILGHGASGTAASMQPYVAGLAARGLQARAVDLPRGRAAAAIAVFVTAATADPDLCLGGHSFGGRMASMAAAQLSEAGTPPPALVCFSYPLHRPGLPEIESRTAHWPAIKCPVLLLSGDRDPFARVELLRGAVARLPDVELVVFAGDGHGLPKQREAALDAAADFLRRCA